MKLRAILKSVLVYRLSPAAKIGKTESIEL